MSPPSDVVALPDAVARVRAYHQRTKHMPGRYAPGPGYMDWANQPDPFRRFLGARVIELPLVPDDGTPPYDSLFRSKATPPRPLTVDNLGLFLELSLGLTAWKEFQGTRAGRCAATHRAAIYTRQRGTWYCHRLSPCRIMPGCIITHLASTLSKSAASLTKRRGAPSNPRCACRRLPRRPHVGALARGLEVRRACLPLLPT